MSAPDVYIPQHELRWLAFAREAGDYFLAHPEKWTYTSGEVEEGVLFAVRWGLEPLKAHAVLVMMVGGTPRIYGDLDQDRIARPESVRIGVEVDR